MKQRNQFLFSLKTDKKKNFREILLAEDLAPKSTKSTKTTKQALYYPISTQVQWDVLQPLPIYKVVFSFKIYEKDVEVQTHVLWVQEPVNFFV